jgi:hypothetical protein
MAGKARRALEKLKRVLASLPGATAAAGKDPSGYPHDPVGYCSDILGMTLTPQQAEIARALLEPPHRVMVLSANNQGKTALSGALVNWFFDNHPGICITTAPEYRSVKDTCWKEVRRLRRGRPGFRGDQMAELYKSAWHYAKGFTVRPGKGESFQGRHDLRLMFLFEEAVGIQPVVWETTATMFKPTAGHFWFAYLNPTDTTSEAFLQSQATGLNGQPKWRVFNLSALEHVNIVAQLAGDDPPIPAAVTLEQLEDWIAKWCDPVPAGERQAGDIEWRPGSGKWYRPGPIGEARILGRWPSLGTYGVWSEAIWAECLRGPCPPFPLDALPVIGCDAATGKGDDFMAIHTRWGDISLGCEASNTMDPCVIFGRLKETAADLAALANRERQRHQPGVALVTPEQIPIRIDDDGVGASIAAFLRADKYNVTAVGAGTAARNPARYPRRRDEVWFLVAERAKIGGVHLGKLAPDHLRRLKQQLLAPRWELDARGRRVVEKKEDTKDKIGRSPDSADAFNLCYLEGVEFTPPPLAPLPEPRLNLFPSSSGGQPQRERREHRGHERAPFGQRW